MSIYSGILSRNPEVMIPEEIRRVFKEKLSRTPGDDIFEIRQPNLHITKLNIGALPGTGIIKDIDGDISILAGEILYPSDRTGNGYPSRDVDLSKLHNECKIRNWKTLRQSTGTFSSVHYSSTKKSITLISDRLGIRPIYYFVDADYVVFSTALRVLLELEQVVPLAMDIRAVAEIACFGQPLGERTAYAEIKRIREAQVIEIDQHCVKTDTYWRWDQISQTDINRHDLPKLAYERFVDAIKRRLSSDRTSAAFLSGGLDSRAIVSILRMLDINVHTTNWAEPDSQDYVFGKLISSVLGCIHQDTPKSNRERIGDSYKAKGVEKWLQSEAVLKNPPHRPHAIWSGDGGSVGIGHVYLNAAAVNEIRNGRVDSGVKEFLNYNNWNLPTRLFSRNFASQIATIPSQGIIEELSRFECQDPGRSLHLFLLANDQRRHNTSHFENIDLDRTEFLMPFFDSDFLECVLSAEVDTCLRHSFYMDWLKNFPALTLSVPWQVYPNHQPCPLPHPTALAYQWNSDEVNNSIPRETRSNAIKSLRNVIRAKSIPFFIIDRTYLLAASLATAVGIRDFSYAVRVANVFSSYWEICDGNISTT